MGASRAWTMMCRDFIKDSNESRKVIYRHMAWLTALRYLLRTQKSWETTTNRTQDWEYMQSYRIPEWEVPLEEELLKYIKQEEWDHIRSKSNKPIQLLSIQSNALKTLNKEGLLEDFRYLAMHSALRELSGHQGKCERIKNFPYPRQYATINTLLVKLFCLLLPLAMLGAFDSLNDTVSGIVKGNMVWFVIPFSVLISWVYISLDQVGESTANPFEGNANDIPISQMSRGVEIDIREMLGETDLPAALQPQNDIVL